MNYQSLCKNKNDYNTVFIIVNRLSKCSIFMLCIKETTAKNMTWMYIDWVYWIYESSDFIVSDWELQFISAFWNEFCEILEIKLKLSTAHHAQTDDQTEIVNQHIQQWLWFFVNHYQNNWSELLLMIDFVAAALSQKSTDFFSFQIEFEFEFCTSFDWQLYVKHLMLTTE